jgi:alpha-tubulin suppressor-like RCC1 family protein/predicted Ser/Thr protein kinase
MAENHEYCSSCGTQIGDQATFCSTCGAGVLKQTVISHYLVGELLGGGGMGVVYKATDRRDDTPVALKILHPHLAADKNFQDRFLREAHLGALLHSPYTVQLLQFGVEDGYSYIAMEYVEGASLKAAIGDGRLSTERALRIAIQVARALEEAQARGVVHRDIKPDNVLLKPDDSVKVTDFGIARQLSGGTLTQVGAYVGTPGYSAPEQVTGTADHRSDIYALGATLYHALVGRAPYSGGIAAIVDQQQKTLVLDPLLGQPPAVVHVVQRSLQRDPARRYQTAGEMATDLERALVSPGEVPATATVQDAPAPLAPPPTLATEASVQAPAVDTAAPTVAGSGEPRRRGRGLFWLVGGGVLAAAALAAGLLFVAGGDDEDGEEDEVEVPGGGSDEDSDEESGGDDDSGGGDGGGGGGGGEGGDEVEIQGVLLAAGGEHSLWLRDDGTLLAWGDDSFGQLGDGPESATPDQCAGFPCSTAPIEVPGVKDVTAVSAGYRHSLVLLEEGSVMTWGWDASGQLGDGPDAQATCATDQGEFDCATTPIRIADLNNVVAVSAGESHSLALLSDGTVMAWGSDAAGQLGDGPQATGDCEAGPCRRRPMPVPGLENVVAIAAGFRHSLALLDDGRLMAWGWDAFGQLGDGAGSPEECNGQGCATAPREVANISDVRAIAAGGGHSLALLEDGRVMAWGWDTFGQLGDGPGVVGQCGADVVPCSPLPVEVGVGETLAVAAAGGISVALLADGTLAMWGEDSSGQLGDGSNSREQCEGGGCSTSPVTVSGLEGVVHAAVGDDHALALVDEGAAFAWGDDSRGKLGNGPNGAERCVTFGLEEACYTLPIEVSEPE